MKQTIKSLFCLFLVACIMLSMCACGEETKSEQKSAVDKKDNGEAAESTEEIIPVDKIIVDNNECFVKITNITIRNTYECVMEVEYENRTSTNLMCELQKASVNGIARELGSISMDGNETGTEEFRLGSKTLAENGVDKYTDIAMTFWVYYLNLGGPVDTIVTESVQIYPYGEENATRYVRETQPTDRVLVDNNDVTVIVTGYDRSDDRWFGVNMYIVNKTDGPITFDFENVNINGVEARIGGGTLFTMRSVEPGLCFFASLTWQTSKLEENGITEIEDITFSMHIMDDDPYSEYLFDGVFTLNP